MDGQLAACLTLMVFLAILLLILTFTRPYDPYYGYVVTKRSYGRGFDLRIKRKVTTTSTHP